MTAQMGLKTNSNKLLISQIEYYQSKIENINLYNQYVGFYLSEYSIWDIFEYDEESGLYFRLHPRFNKDIYQLFEN